jgi:hypothetical protein
MKITAPITAMPIGEERKCFRCNKKFIPVNPMMWICSDCFKELREVGKHDTARLDFVKEMKKLADRHSVLHKKDSVIKYEEMVSDVKRLLKMMWVKRAKLREKEDSQ